MPYYLDFLGRFQEYTTGGFEEDKQYGGFFKTEIYASASVSDFIQSTWADESPLAQCVECGLIMLKKRNAGLGLNADPMAWSVDSGEYLCLPCRDNLHTIEEIKNRSKSE